MEPLSLEIGGGSRDREIRGEAAVLFVLSEIDYTADMPAPGSRRKVGDVVGAGSRPVSRSQGEGPRVELRLPGAAALVQALQFDGDDQILDQLRIPAIVIAWIGHRDHPGGVGAERRGWRARRGRGRSEATLMGCSGLGGDLLAA